MTFEDMQEIKGENQKENMDLDRYGVWVKKPPQTIVETQNDVTQDNCAIPEIQQPTQEIQIPVKEEVTPINNTLETSPELEESFDLPDFDSLESAELTSEPNFSEAPIQDSPVVVENVATENIPVVDIPSELEESFDLPGTENLEASDLPSIPEDFSSSIENI